MKVCFPVMQDEGMESRIYGHFGSALKFVLVDTETGATLAVPNHDTLNPDAGCNPFKALSGRELDGVVVGGVGDGLLDMLNMMGYRVFEAQSESIRENLDLITRQELPELSRQCSAEAGRCDGEDAVGQCSHSHGDCDGCNT